MPLKKCDKDDPRGDGAVLDDRGQPNIIDYSNKEPLLYSLGENSSHEYPGKIVINNESRYVDTDVKRSTIPNAAETGRDSTGADRTQPTIPTGAPLELKNNAHGYNFNNKIKLRESKMTEDELFRSECQTCGSPLEDHPNNTGQEAHEFLPEYPIKYKGSNKLAEVVSIPSGLVDRKIGGAEPDDKDKQEMKESLIRDEGKKEVRKELKEALKTVLGDLDGVPGLAEAPILSSYKKLGKPFEEKSDTGDDHSRSGPGGKLERDNNNSINYQGKSDTKIHLATPYYDGKEPHDVDGNVLKLKPKEPGLTLGQAFTDSDKRQFEINEKMSEAVQAFTHSSSWIGNVSYDPETLVMDVIMNGKKYTHPNITQREFDSFEGSPSKGEHWNRFFRGQYSEGLSESLNYEQIHKMEFPWIPKDAMEEMKKEGVKKGGRFLLAVAIGPTITDHRYSLEKEERRRRWTEEEMMQTIRTARRKLININHLWSKKNPQSGHIFDSNWNFDTKRGEMILWETDFEIIDAIRNDIISAVSMNTGQPRDVKKACDTNECFDEPQGVVLGEDDGNALAYIVTDPRGFKYNGQVIPAMPPGMKFTKIYIVE